MTKLAPTRARGKGKAAVRTGRWRPKFIRFLGESGNVTFAAEAAGVERQTAYNARAKDEAFAAQWDEALERAADLLEREARRRAVEGLLLKKFTKSGEPIIDPETGVQYVERVYDTTLLIFLLKGMRPAKYRENHHIEHKGDAGPRTVTEGDVAAATLLEELRAALGGEAAEQRA